MSSSPVAIAVHGGAGTILRHRITPELEQRYRATLEAALRAGHERLLRGEPAIDAVMVAVMVLEDSPLFNAGKGSVLSHEQRIEMDAAIMHGGSLSAGAAAAVRHVRNPVRLAREVMEHSAHVMLSGAGAEEFARERGLPLEPDSYFVTERRLTQWRALNDKRPFATTLSESEASSPEAASAPDAAGSAATGPDAAAGQAATGDSPPAAISDSGDVEDAPVTLPPATLAPGTPPPGRDSDDHEFGTVGAVALDVRGDLAAATSTGGMTNKRWGRIGDSPVIGAGTYADNRAAAVSCTGHGEMFMRSVAAHQICARVKLTGQSLEQAARAVIFEELAALGGQGGVIALDARGQIVFSFNTLGMYRGSIDPQGVLTTAIFDE